jgi:hypothetical protein
MFSLGVKFPQYLTNSEYASDARSLEISFNSKDWGKSSH